MAMSLTCDGVRRRDFLKVGAIGAGLTLSGYLPHGRRPARSRAPKATNAIFINLTGGPSHMDTFDLKPDAPAEFRGEFNPIKTNVAGVEICEHLPKLAQCADKFAILRGVSHSLGAHELGTEYMNTGNRPIPSLEYPGYGSVVSKERPARQDLPPFVAIPNSNQRPGFLGVQYAPLNTTAAPRAGQPFTVRGITLGGGLTIEEVERRQNLLADLDTTFAAVESNSQLLTGLDRFGEQAHAIITSKRARDGLRHQQGAGRVRQAVRRRPVRPVLPAGHAAGRGGRAVRGHDARRLGHAPGQLHPPQDATAAQARHGPGGPVQRPASRRACWKRRWSSSRASSAARRRSTPAAPRVAATTTRGACSC